MTIVTAALGGAPVAAAAPYQDRLVTLDTRPGVTENLFVMEPDGPPRAAVLLFPGAEGKLDLSRRKPSWIGKNFLVRARWLFARQGLLVAVIDTPSDRPDGLRGFRSTPEHAVDIAAAIRYLRQAAAVPVWLVGTSRGTVSAVNGATLTIGGPDGLVISSTVTRASPKDAEIVPGFALAKIGVPTLMVHHRHDACPVTRYDDAVALLPAFTAAPRRELLTFDGGDAPQGGPCGAFAEHGFAGLEATVVKAIADWITAPAR